MIPGPTQDIGGAASAAQLSESTRQRILRLLGLGFRGRLVVAGAEQVREHARKGALSLAVVAQDISRHSLDKVVPILRAKRIFIVEWPSAAELGAVAGRDATAAIGIVDQALARGIRDAISSAGAESPTEAGDVARYAERRKG